MLPIPAQEFMANIYSPSEMPFQLKSHPTVPVQLKSPKTNTPSFMVLKETHSTCKLFNEMWWPLYLTHDTQHISRVDLSQASESELENLASACEPATFGVDQKDVLDESYRKARKLDVAHFATTFELRKSGIMDVVRAALLEGHDSNIPVEADLYKLNVYGECRTNNLNNWSYVHPSDHCTCSDKGSFFKSHRDTPRSGTMFASLVVIFPVAHEGGALKLCHGGNEWTVDSATVNNTTSPVISYIAFYSDVEHEVTPVTSGHSVTLTWNIYFQRTVKPPDYFLLPNLSVHPKTSES